MGNDMSKQEKGIDQVCACDDVTRLEEKVFCAEKRQKCRERRRYNKNRYNKNRGTPVHPLAPSVDE